MGKALGCSVDVDELCFACGGFVIEKLRQRSVLLARRLPWLARAVLTSLKHSFSSGRSESRLPGSGIKDEDGSVAGVATFISGAIESAIAGQERLRTRTGSVGAAEYFQRAELAAVFANLEDGPGAKVLS